MALAWKLLFGAGINIGIDIGIGYETSIYIGFILALAAVDVQSNYKEKTCCSEQNDLINEEFLVAHS
jgi:hypothetical protein